MCPKPQEESDNEMNSQQEQDQEEEEEEAEDMEIKDESQKAEKEETAKKAEEEGDDNEEVDENENDDNEESAQNKLKPNNDKKVLDEEEEEDEDEDQDSRVNILPNESKRTRVGDEEEEEYEQEEEQEEVPEEEKMDVDEEQDSQSVQNIVKTEQGVNQQQNNQGKQSNQQQIKVKSSPAASPPKPISATRSTSKMIQDPDANGHIDDLENHIICEIKDIQEFKWCLDSVKFPTGSKAKFNDVIFSALSSGITLKSHSQTGTIMTKCLLKKDFFENQYHIEIRNNADKKKDFSLKENMMTPLLEFCLPFNELKQIVDGMVDESNNVMVLEYPAVDGLLEVRIPEETKGEQKLRSMTTVHLETYEAKHNLEDEKQLCQSDISALVFGKLQHFKRALKEFSFLADKEPIEIKFSNKYPQISFRHVNDVFQRNHVVKFNEKIDDLIIKEMKQECSAYYTIESLRLAFSRIGNDNLICIVTMYNQGYLSVKHMDEDKVLMIESIILPLEATEEEQ